MQDSRQLSAVMFTDMVGYTSLMQEDEQKAKKNRDRHREVLERLTGDNQGRILQYFGDGTLSVFDSAIQAVRCALGIQVELLGKGIPLRIGLHVGDIVFEKDSVYGDAVNVASRIESISIPGSVLFSDRVHDDIKNHPEFSTVSLGHFKFKNVKRPIEVFALTNGQLTVPTARQLREKVPSAIKSVAVLPFVNMSRDPENDYFSDGMTEELINAFTRVDGLDVTARTSSFAFKGKNVDIREIGKELSVDTILEGSVRKAGNRVRITSQLINVADGYHLFSETFDRELEDIFAVQDEIALKITAKLTHQMGGGKPGEHLVKSSTENLDAYNLYLRGIFYWNKWTPNNIKRAIQTFEKVLEMQPDFAAAYSRLAICYVILGTRGNWLPGKAYPRAREYARKALELDDELYNSHLALAMVKMFYEWDWEGSYQSIRRAMELNPGAGEVQNTYGFYLQTTGRLDEAVEAMEQAARLDPLSQPIIKHLALIYFAVERYDDALEQLDRILRFDPSHRSALEMKGWCYMGKGRTQKAIEVLEEYKALTDKDYKGVTLLGYAYAKAGRIDDAKMCLAKLKEREGLDREEVLDMDFAVLYAGLGELDKAFEYLERAVEARLAGLFYLKDNRVVNEFRCDPRFKVMLDKAGLIGKCDGETNANGQKPQP